MASALEHFVNNVTSLTSQGKYNETAKYIAKNMEVLTKNASHLDTVLATLQPGTHTLGVLAVLKVRLQHTSHTDANIDTLHATVAEFINVCHEEQIKYAPELFADLCGSYARLLVSGKCAMRGLEVLKGAILKLQESPQHLTSLHAHLMHLCLVSKCFKLALHFLDIDIMDICKEGNHYDVKHFLLYYYYGGMIYTALKKFKRAQYFFQICICTPALAVSHIMLEAFKKFILVSLILEGKMGKIPKYASLVVLRFIKPLCIAYVELETAYASHNPDRVAAIVNNYHDVYVRDHNLGLVKQCVSSLYKSNIQRLTKTFLTLSLVDVANRVNLGSAQEAEKYILNMIEDGEIHANINQRDGMVLFLDNPKKYNSPSMMDFINKQLQACMKVERRLTAMEEDIQVNPQYVKKMMGPSDEEGGGGGALGGPQPPQSSSGSLYAPHPSSIEPSDYNMKC